MPIVKKKEMGTFVLSIKLAEYLFSIFCENRQESVRVRPIVTCNLLFTQGDSKFIAQILPKIRRSLGNFDMSL